MEAAGAGSLFLLNMDEFVKLPAVYRHYKKYRWVRNLTKESQGQ